MRGSVVRRAVATIAALGAVAAPTWAAAAQEDGRRPARAADRLVAFDSCGQLLSHVRRRALPLVGPFGVTAYPGLSNIRFRSLPVDGRNPARTTAPPAPPPPAATTPDAPQEGVDFSGTNVQEAGVDEPDIVKTDGRRLFTLKGGTLHAVALDGGARLVGSLDLSDISPSNLLLTGDRLLVFGTGAPVTPVPRPVPLPGPPTVPTPPIEPPVAPPSPPVTPAPPTSAPPSAAAVPPRPGAARSSAREQLSIAPDFGQQATVMVQIDISNPAAMRVLGRLSVDGGYVSARLTGGTARVVIASSPAGLPFTYPTTGAPAQALRATRANRRILARSGTNAWVPRFKLQRRGASKPVVRGRAVPCRSVSRPQLFSGLGMITVLTVDAAGTLRIMDSDAVMSDGETVYASPTGLYVATQRYFDETQTPSPAAISSTRTLIHRFDTASPTETRYVASGSVPGFLLNQFSLSELDGRLRVASTEEPDWVNREQGQESASAVTVLEAQGGALTQVGRVGGLGRGERIYAVRFLGNRGYVVTFRQVDPLYVVDLTDPANPRVTGELKIPGFSSYLHPVGEDRLIGIGQDADDTGRTTGSQVSLFDVSDPANPRRLAQTRLGEGFSEAEGNHLAFLFWPATSLLVVPLSSYEEGNAFVGAVGLRVGADAIPEVGRITHPPAVGTGPPIGDGPDQFPAPLRRSVVVGDSLLTISDAGIRTSALDTLADRAFLPLP